MNSKIIGLVLLFITLISCRQSLAQFTIADRNEVVSIVYDIEHSALDSIVAHLLARDIEAVTGQTPSIYTSLEQVEGNVIVIGDVTSDLMTRFVDTTRLLGQWETYGYLFKTKPVPGIDQAMFIVGNGPRGMAYGVFDLSKKMGVSPWYWWADVPIPHRDVVTISSRDTFSRPPSVKYRGIFLNDEDWGLRPWASKTFEPKVGTIGPKTYAKIFELLLRLKANMVWPAMHDGTVPFFDVKGNKKMAKKYEIVVGTAHNEPMMQNNVVEWDSEKRGTYNYATNASSVYQYWQQGVKETQDINAIYTVGMRGNADTGMKGARTMQAKVKLLEEIIADQRHLLSQYINEDLSEVPQAFTPYKEVLDIYEHGLDLSEDITIIWPDDNYGYIRRLNTFKESQRSGGAGIYYHISYWGRPHDYLWLSSTHPALIREELTKAYKTGARKIWVINVGDIKPAAFNISLAMDMAYNIDPYFKPGAERAYLQQWTNNIFGTVSDSLDEMMWTYYNLAFERRPEFMGWSQTEPTTPTHHTVYNLFAFGDQLQHRIDRYHKLANKADQFRDEMPQKLKAAYFQLAYYPIVGSAEMNKKFLFREKAEVYATQHRLSARYYAKKSRQAYQRIVEATEFYNNELSNGKWKHMMSMKPRGLPAFQPPKIKIEDQLSTNTNNSRVGLIVEGDSTDLTGIDTNRSPVLTFVLADNDTRFIDLFLKDSTVVSWSVATKDDWIQLSDIKGKLVPKGGDSEVRMNVMVDWSAISSFQNKVTGSVTFSVGNQQKTVYIKALRPNVDSFTGFVEANGYISMYAEHYTRISDQHIFHWKRMEGLGQTGASMMVTPLVINPDSVKNATAVLEYDFYSLSEVAPKVRIFCLPTHPINDQFEVRLAVQIDGSPIDTLNFRTYGRSEKWKQNVLSNTAIESTTFDSLEPGKHTLKIYAIDPGLILDRIEIDLGRLPPHYGVIEETKIK